MAIETRRPKVNNLADVVQMLREWQRDDGSVQVHPGDVGWFWRFGDERTADATRIWSREGATLAVGLLDGPKVLRLAIAPEAFRDTELAQQVVDDLSAPERGVLIEREAYVETPIEALVQDLLYREAGRAASHGHYYDAASAGRCRILAYTPR